MIKVCIAGVTGWTGSEVAKAVIKSTQFELAAAIARKTPVTILVKRFGYQISFETLFGLPDERLTIRHDAGTSALPYVSGTLLLLKGSCKQLDWCGGSINCCLTTIELTSIRKP